MSKLNKKIIEMLDPQITGGPRNKKASWILRFGKPKQPNRGRIGKHLLSGVVLFSGYSYGKYV